MPYTQLEKIKELQASINDIADVAKGFEPTGKGMELEMNWNISKLVSDLLFHSTLNSFDTIEKIKTDFEKEYFETIDLDRLFKRGWIRKILGRYEIPEVVRFGMSFVDKYFDRKEEYQFLSKAVEHFYSFDENIWEDIPREKFLKFLEDYNDKNSSDFEYDALQKMDLIFEDKGKIKILESQFFPFIVRYLYDFLFIKKLNPQLNYFRKNKEVTLEKKVAKKLINQHRKLFPKTPTESELLDFEILKEIEDDKKRYTFDLRSSKNISTWDSTREKILAHLWITLCDDDSLTDTRRIEIWMGKIRLFHFWSIDANYFPREYKIKLLDGITNVLMKENDFSDLDMEVKKIEMDWRNNKNINVIEKPFLGATFSKDKFQSLYERFSYFEDVEQFNQILHYEDGVRLSLYHLIYVLVRFDFKREAHSEKNTYEHFPRIKKLLRASLNKPTIVWKIIHNITSWKPEILPYLIVEPEFSSIIFKVLFSLKVRKGLNGVNEDGAKLVSNLWHSAIELLLENIYSSPKLYEENSQRIFEILALIENSKFPHDKSNPLKTKIIRQRVKKTKDQILEFLSPKNDGYLYSRDGAKLVEPKIIKLLFGKIKRFKPIIPNHNEGILKIGIQQLEMLIWFHKMMVKFESAKRRLPVSLNNVSKEMIKTYRTIYKVDKVENSWLDTFDYLPLVDWEYIFECTSMIYREDDFLSPNKFSVKKKGSDENNYRNIRIGWEIRFHLKILLILFSHFENKKKDLNQNQIELKNKVESKIIFYIKNYNKDSDENRSINIFSSFYRMYVYKAGLELFTPIVLFINRLRDSKKRKNIIVNLVDSNDVNRLLQLNEQLTSEGDKTYLRIQITEKKIFNYLESGLNFKETQATLSYLMSDTDFIEIAKKVHHYWDKKILSRVKGKHGFHDQEVFAYQVNLVLAYHERNIEKLDKIEKPKNSYREKEFGDFIAFFKALIKFEIQEYQEAYKLLNKLTGKPGVYQVLSAQNRLIIHRKIAEQKLLEDKDEAKMICRKMLSEWEEFRDSVLESERIKIESSVVKLSHLFCYDVLDENIFFDDVFEKLMISVQYDSSFAELRVENFVKRKMERHAIEFIEEVGNYHQLYNDKIPDFVEVLKRKATTEEEIKRLRGYYKTIHLYNPERQVEIISDELFEDASLPNFSAKKIINACHGMLSKINSIEKIDNENKYNDLVKVILGASLESENWNVGQEHRSGEPASGSKDLGRLDFGIEKRNKVIAVCEALKYDNNPKRHIEKVFNYDSERKLFFIINYYNNETGFEKAWQNYLKTKVPKADYPAGYEILENYPKDVSEQFRVQSGSVRVGFCKLKSGTVMYHLFLDLRYLEKEKKKKK